MVVEKILKQLTPERIKKEIEAIQKIKLPPDLQKWVIEYNKVGERDEFIWKWAYRSIPMVTLSNILKKYQNPIRNVKFLIIMFIILLDDVADKMKNERLLNELLKIPSRENEIKYKHLDKLEKKYLNFVQEIWHDIQKVIRKFPYYQKVKKTFKFDIEIFLINAIYYGYLINTNHYLINKVEYQERFSYNIQGFLNLDLDLMCCYNEFEEEIGDLREIAWRSQRLAQMMNWISTWEREIKENDFSSGIFAFALNKKILSIDKLEKKYSKSIIDRIKKANLEKEIINECDEEYYNIKLVGKKIRKNVVNEFILSLKEFMILQLCSKGHY